MTLGNISHEDPQRELLEKLKEKGIGARFYDRESKESHMGYVNQIGKRYVSVLPYTIYESIPRPDCEKFLPRIRIEKELEVPLVIQNLSIEPLAKGYMEDFVKWTNYFTSRFLPTKVAESLVNENYILPDKEQIEAFEESLKEKKIVQLNLLKNQPTNR